MNRVSIHWEAELVLRIARADMNCLYITNSRALKIIRILKTEEVKTKHARNFCVFFFFKLMKNIFIFGEDSI